MGRSKAILIDITKCIGCGACEQACKVTYGLPEQSETRLSTTAYNVVEEHGDHFEKGEEHSSLLVLACCLVVMGFIANRLNVSITGLRASSQIYYVPKWTEFALSLATITAVVLTFRYAVIYLEILPKFPQRPRWMVTSAAADA